MAVRYVGVQTYAGGFDVGAVQSGLQLVGRLENKGGFGLHQCEANRHVLGDAWESQATDPSQWEPVDAEVVLTNPPCSAWSALTYGVIKDSANHPISNCMWDSIRYAGKVRPEVFVMESVQGAVVKGTGFMRQLRDHLDQLTGLQYHLTHVIQNNGALGGASNRRRYFMVLSRIPFGVELPDFNPPPTLGETIGDLEALDYRTWGPQRYVAERSPWVRRECESPNGQVDGHITAKWTTPGVERLIDLMDGDTADVKVWPPDKCLVVALRNYYQAHGKLPASWHFQRQKSGRWADEALIEKDMEMGYTRPRRWSYDKVAYVVIGGAMYLVLHPTQARLFTHRECARIMGFPDTWQVASLQGLRGLEEGWGKGVSAQSGRWIAHWVNQSVLGMPGSFRGIPVTEHHRLLQHGPCERELVIDVSRIPKQASLTMASPVIDTLLESVA